MLRLYQIEADLVHRQLDHMFRIRTLIAAVFAAILSAILVSHKGAIALGALVFLLAWGWEYVHDRYLMVYVLRTRQLEQWLAKQISAIPQLQELYATSYANRWLSPEKFPRLSSFLDPTRVAFYLVVSFSPIFLAELLGVPWT